MRLLLLLFLFASCRQWGSTQPSTTDSTRVRSETASTSLRRNGTGTLVHVFVALCDNKYQGFVPVPKAIGNGQDANSNLYWGCDYGLRTYFRKAGSDWMPVQTWKKPDSLILERILYRHKTKDAWLLADAYDGRYIRNTAEDFLRATAGRQTCSVVRNDDTLYFGGAADLSAYIGHNGLMDFRLPLAPDPVDSVERNAIVLACFSKSYFAPHLARSRAKPLLWTTNLMCPEAYTLHDALRAWLNGGSREDVRNAAAMAYAKFQKCSVKAARGLLVN